MVDYKNEKQMHIINLEPLDYSPKAKAILETLGTLEESSMDRNELLRKIHKYDVAVVRLAHKFDEEVFSAAKKLKVIVTATTGVNHIDLVSAQKRQVKVLSLRGETAFLENITSTAELGWGLLLQLMRPITPATKDVLAGQWRRDCFKGYEISGKTVGILGCGRLGKKSATYAKAFGAHVLVNDIHKIEEFEQVELDRLLQSSDILFIHLPYNETTHHFLNQERFNSIKHGARIINTARGEIVDEEILLQALKSGKIVGAAIDVMQGENLGLPSWPTSDPLIEYARHNDNLIITPHIGGAAYESMEKTECFMAEKLKAFLAGTHE